MSKIPVPVKLSAEEMQRMREAREASRYRALRDALPTITRVGGRRVVVTFDIDGLTGAPDTFPALGDLARFLVGARAGSPT